MCPWKVGQRLYYRSKIVMSVSVSHFLVGDRCPTVERRRITRLLPTRDETTKAVFGMNSKSEMAVHRLHPSSMTLHASSVGGKQLGLGRGGLCTAATCSYRRIRTYCTDASHRNPGDGRVWVRPGKPHGGDGRQKEAANANKSRR